MPPKRKAPGGTQQQRRVRALRQAVRDARAARLARRGEEQQMPAQRVEPGVEESQAGGVEIFI